jgi:CRISPR-associated endonuclease/helicase Cas3
LPGRTYLAHSKPGLSREHWQPLRQHLKQVAELAGEFGSAFGARDWAYLAGLWHDVGKYSCEFQEYLAASGEDETHAAEVGGRVDHSTAGAQHAVASLDIPGHLLAYAVSGHHSGLLDGRSDGPCLEARLSKTVREWRHGLHELPPVSTPTLPDYVRRAVGRPPAEDAHAVAFFTRMLFSCLVDADFLDTERFVDPDRHGRRPRFPDGIIPAMEHSLDVFLAAIGSGTPARDDVRLAREEVRRACLEAAARPPGPFSLTAPTGGGKTLAALAFGLRHARVHGLRRVIYVAPFITIIEQNADVFRRALASLVEGSHPGLVLEDHSNLDIGSESAGSRLAAENWEAPLIVTTAVQFYESLFASRTSRCRKLHRIARSVVILDEAQVLPVQYLKPCLRVLRELSRNYGTTVVLCTATQPAVHRRDDFPIGLEGVREIVSEPVELSRRLRRTTAHYLGSITDAELGERLLDEPRVLCIVNTRGHAARLFRVLGEREGHFHLSARMCPEHRTEVLSHIKTRLEGCVQCRVVSTQLIEAGIDVDFPAVFRTLAGIDSIAQAAGRCNRNGLLPDLGRVFIFRSEHVRSERYFAESAGCGAQIVALYEDPLSIEAVEHYFRLYLWTRSADWDAKQILDGFNLFRNDTSLPFSFDFARAGREFQLIETANRPVLVPWRERGRRLCERLRRREGRPDPQLLRSLQRYAVDVPERDWKRHIDSGFIELVEDRYAILASPELHYSDTLGLTFGEDEPSLLTA